MSPIHHHFELCGWSERKVVYSFWIFTLIMGILGLLVFDFCFLSTGLPSVKTF